MEPYKIPGEVEVFTAERVAITKRAAAIVVDSHTTAQVANTYMLELAEAAKTLEAKRVELKAPFLAGCRQIDDYFSTQVRALDESRRVVKGRIDTYLRAEAERIAREAREAEERAAAERRRLQEEADRREAAARQERERAAQEAAKKQGADAAAALAAGERRAAALEENAAVKRLEADTQVATAPAASAPTIKGFRARTKYDCEVVDLLQLVKAIADGRASISCVMANEQTLRKMAEAMKEGFNVPGCRLKTSRI